MRQSNELPMDALSENGIRTLRGLSHAAAQVFRRYNRVHPQSVDMEDIEQVAFVGALKGHRSYDARKGSEHGETYDGWVYYHALGEVRHWARDCMLPIRKTRSAWERRTPLRVLSFDDVHDGDDGRPHIIDEFLADRRSADPESAAVAADILSALPKRLRMLAVVCWLWGYTQGEAGRMIGVSQKHVSRLLARAKKQLKEEFAA